MIAIFSALLIVFFGAYSGSTGTSLLWRRLGIPFLLTLNAWLLCSSLWVFTIFLPLFGAISCGYGVPSLKQGKTGRDIHGNLIWEDFEDEGSTIGKYFYMLTDGSHLWTDILTRGIIGFMIGLSMISIPVLRCNWIAYILCVSGLIGNYILWGAIVKEEGSFKINKVEILWEDIYIYLGVALFSFIIFIFKHPLL